MVKVTIFERCDAHIYSTGIRQTFVNHEISWETKIMCKWVNELKTYVFELKLSALRKTTSLKYKTFFRIT